MPTEEVTELLRAWRGGDAGAGERVLPVIYAELRRLAGAKLAGAEAGATLQPTALVHEAFLRLAGQRADFENRAHFLAIASTLMRRVLIDHARARQAAKRPRGVPLTLPTGLAGGAGVEVELLDLDRALERLAAEHPRPARVVEMRFFAGLTEGEIGEALGLTERTVHRDWTFARAWLLRALAGEGR